MKKISFALKALKNQTIGMAICVCTFLIVVAMPSLAFQVQLHPISAQLGDTLSVVIQLDQSGDPTTPPLISMNKQNYPAYPIDQHRFRAFLPTTPLDQPGTWPIQVTQAGQRKNLAVEVRDREFPTQSIWLDPGKDVDISDYEFNRVDAFKKLETPKKLWNGKFLRPNEGEITAIYGVRRYYNGEFAKDYYHRGVDYAGDKGSPVVAPAPGKVALVGLESQGFQINGNIIGIDHGQGITSAFLHLSRIDVKEGDFVQAGQVIGAVGDTGAAAGPHLHWGLYVHGLAVDPVPWRYQGLE